MIKRIRNTKVFIIIISFNKNHLKHEIRCFLGLYTLGFNFMYLTCFAPCCCCCYRRAF